VNSIGQMDNLHDAVDWLCVQSSVLDRWGHRLAATLKSGGRLLAGGGSVDAAQYLTTELAGRFGGELSAMALHADTSAMTAIGNDYGYEDVFARQVAAHGRPGDVLMLLSTSGRSPNLLQAARTARLIGATCWAMTGRAPNPLASIVDEALCVPAPSATVQETHLVAVHVLCGAVENALLERRAS
jgi:D-sedoheptulose 7-phosphate isomerase